MSAFFGEVTPALQVAFADLFDITKAELVAAAKAFATDTGESYPLAADVPSDMTEPYRTKTLL